jgi:hypothetical protein
MLAQLLWRYRPERSFRCCRSQLADTLMRSAFAAAAAAAAVLALAFFATPISAVTGELFTQPDCKGTGQTIDPMDIHDAIENNEDFKVESNKYKSLKLRLSGGEGSAESVRSAGLRQLGNGEAGSTSSSWAAGTRAR